jgi:uncharacterized protein (DUF305 family)
VKTVVIACTTAIVVALAAVVIAIVATDDMHGPGWGDRDGAWMMSGRGDARERMRESAPESEVEYLVEMVAHHEDAVVAAGELARSDTPALRLFGESVVAVQSAQIDLMEEWLAAWYPDAPDASYEPMMRDLSDLEGDELDEAFLRDMIPHHAVAVMMSQQLLVRGLAEHAQVEELARTIRDAQHAEMRTMMQWLHATGGAGSGMWMGARATG